MLIISYKQISMSVIPTMVDVISIVRIPLEGIIVTVMMAIT